MHVHKDEGATGGLPALAETRKDEGIQTTWKLLSLRSQRYDERESTTQTNLLTVTDLGNQIAVQAAQWEVGLERVPGNHEQHGG